MQMRNVLCAKKEGAKILRILSNDQCKKDKEMSGVQKCSVRPCQAGWYIYPWEAVSQARLLYFYRVTMCMTVGACDCGQYFYRVTMCVTV